MAIPCYIPSKDRAGQCDLLLSSLEQNAPGLFQPWVIYTGSNDKFKEGYKILKEKWYKKNTSLWFIEEIDGEKQFYSWLDLQQNIYNNNAIIGLFSDDCIFYRPDPIGETALRTMFDTYKDKVFSFTYRLGQNITVKDYVTGEKNSQQPEEYFKWGKILSWDYTKIPFEQMHGFTVGFDGYIYRAGDLLELSDCKSFGRICFWEHLICEQFRQKGNAKHFMASPQQSCVFVQQINTSHEYGHRTNKTFNMSTEEINHKWLDGYEIDLQSINWDDPPVNCTHGERKFTFRKV